MNSTICYLVARHLTVFAFIRTLILFIVKFSPRGYKQNVSGCSGPAVMYLACNWRQLSLLPSVGWGTGSSLSKEDYAVWLSGMVSGLYNVPVQPPTKFIFGARRSNRSNKSPSPARWSIGRRWPPASLALSQTPAYTARPRIRASVSRTFTQCACLLPSFQRYSLYQCTYLRRDGEAELTKVSGLPIQIQSPIQALTGPDVE